MSEAPRDPFAPTADPRAYVARAACERALQKLQTALAQGVRRILFHGPPGLGKTFLLRLLLERSENVRLVLVGYPALPATDLCDWVLRGLGEEPGSDPQRSLLALSERSDADPLVLAVDDAHSLPAETTARLRALVEASEGRLRILAVATDGEAALALDEALSPECVVRFDDPMSREELADYVAARLGDVDAADEVKQRFDPETLDWLHAESGGIPGELHRHATRLVRGRRAPSRGPELSDEPFEPEPLPAAGGPGGRSESGATAAGSRLGAAVLGVAAAAAGLLLLWLWLGDGRETLPDLEPVAVLSERSVVAPAEPELPSALQPSELPPTDSGTDSPAEAVETEVAELPALLPEEPAFTVNLNATPWAEVEMDGRELGTTPLAGVPLEPGRHRFRARMADGRVLERELEVDEEHRHIVFE